MSSARPVGEETPILHPIYIVHSNQGMKKALLCTASTCAGMGACIGCLEVVTIAGCLCLMPFSVTVIPSLDTDVIGKIAMLVGGLLCPTMFCTIGSAIVGKVFQIKWGLSGDYCGLDIID